MPPPRLPYCAIVAVLGLFGCGSDASHWQIVGYGDPSSDGLHLIARPLPTGSETSTDSFILDLSRARSTWIDVRVGGRLFFDDATDVDGGVSRQTMFRGQTTANANYSVRQRGDMATAVPQDYDSLLLFTVQAHLHGAILFFQDLGVAPPSEPMIVFMHPALITSTTFPSSDTAAYSPHADALFLLRMRVLQDIPLSASPGVLIHEYAHRVFNRTAYGGGMFSLLRRGAQPDFTRTFNLVRAVDEGIADFFAAAATGDPHFLSHSLSPMEAKKRSLAPSSPPLVAAEWVSGGNPIRDDLYDPYPLGNALAALLWALAEQTHVDEVGRAVLAAERELFRDWQRTFSYQVGDIEILVLDELNRPSILCPVLLERYAAVASRFSSLCPAQN